MKHFRILPILIMVTLSFVLSSCSTETLVQVQDEQISSNVSSGSFTKLAKTKKWPPDFIIDSCFGYGKITFDTTLHKFKDIKGDVNPNLREGDGCGQRTVYGWTVDHYEPMPGKVLGIWNYRRTEDELRMLKNKYGYSGLLINEPSYDISVYSLAVNTLKFDPANIMVNIRDDAGSSEWMNRINNMPAGNYYIGEAAEHGCWTNSKRMYSPNDFIEIKNYLNSHNRTGSLLVTDGYKRCYHLQTIGNYCDKMMYSAYLNWNLWQNVSCLRTNMSWGPGAEASYLEGGIDQRDSWTDMRHMFGAKFSRTWIKTSEVTEFYTLFLHAASLGLDQIWVYNYMEDNNTPSYRSDQYGNIAEAAWENGYLKQYIQQVILIYKCDKYVNPNFPCPCDPTLEEDWYLYSITPTGYIIENSR